MWNEQYILFILESYTEKDSSNHFEQDLKNKYMLD